MSHIKRLVAVMLALVLALSLTAGAVTFSDVSARTDEGRAVTLLAGLGIIGGYPDGTFGGENAITRAEFAKILYVTFTGSEDISLYNGAESGFPDVASDAWFAPYVVWAARQGIIGGYPDGEFKPDNNVTIGEVAKMLVVALGYSADSYAFPYGFIDQANKLTLFENITGAAAGDDATRNIVAVMTFNALFTGAAEGFRYWNSSTSSWDYKEPITTIFGAKSQRAEVIATSTYAPGVGGITKEGQVTILPSGSASNLIVDTDYNCDSLIGHDVEVWYLEPRGEENDRLDNRDNVIAMLDLTERTYTISHKNFLITGADLTDTVTYLDLYTIQSGIMYPLFKACLTESGGSWNFNVPGTTGAPTSSISSLNPNNNNRDKYYAYWTCGATPDDPVEFDMWLVNYGVSDPAYGISYLRPYNSSMPPFTHYTNQRFTFVDNDTEILNRWDKVLVTYSRTSQITAVSNSGVTIKGINNDRVIPMSQLSIDTNLCEKDTYVDVAATARIIDGEVKDFYTVTPVTVLKGKTIDTVTRYSYVIEGKTYYATQEWLGANPTAINTTWQLGTVNVPAFEDCVKFNAVMAGSAYDIVLTTDGYIWGFFPSEPYVPDYMLVKNVNIVQGDFLYTNTPTVTGLLADGTTKTFSVNVEENDFNGNFTIGGLPVFDPSEQAAYDRVSWYNEAGTGPAAKNDIGIVGKLVKYQLDGDGMVKYFEEIEQPYYDLYRLDHATNSIYTKNAGGSYKLSYRTNSSTAYFTYSDNNTPDDYSDDEFGVARGSAFSEFEDTAIAGMSLESGTTNEVEALFITGDYGRILGETKFVYFTLNNRIDLVDEDHARLAIQMLIDGKVTWINCPIADISNAKTQQDIMKAALKAAFDPGEGGAMHDAIEIGSSDLDKGSDAVGIRAMLIERSGFIEIDADTSSCARIFLTNYWKNDANNPDYEAVHASRAQMVDLDVTKNEVYEVKANQTNHFYRGSIKAIDGRVITINAVNRYGGRAYNQGLAEAYIDANGKCHSRITYYDDDTTPYNLIPIADDAMIMVVNQMFSYGSSSVYRGSISDLNVNTADDNYVIEYVLDYTDSSKTSVEITQMIAYAQPSNNTTVTDYPTALLEAYNGNLLTPTSYSEAIQIQYQEEGLTAGSVEYPQTYRAQTSTVMSSVDTIKPSDFTALGGGTIELFGSATFDPRSQITDANPQPIVYNYRGSNEGYSQYYIKLTSAAGAVSYHMVMMQKLLGNNTSSDASLSRAFTTSFNPNNYSGAKYGPREINYRSGKAQTYTLANEIQARRASDGATVRYFSDDEYTNAISQITLSESVPEYTIYVEATAPDGSKAYYKIYICLEGYEQGTIPANMSILTAYGTTLEAVASDPGKGTATDPYNLKAVTVSDAQAKTVEQSYFTAETGATLEFYSLSSFAAGSRFDTAPLAANLQYTNSAQTGLGYSTVYIKSTYAGSETYYKLQLQKTLAAANENASIGKLVNGTVKAQNELGNSTAPKTINKYGVAAGTITYASIIEAADANASIQFFTTNAFSAAATTGTLRSGGTLTVYAVVTAADGTTTQHYRINLSETTPAAPTDNTEYRIATAWGKTVSYTTTGGYTIASPLQTTAMQLETPAYTISASDFVPVHEDGVVRIYVDSAYTKELTGVTPIPTGGRYSGGVQQNVGYQTYYLTVTIYGETRYFRMMQRSTGTIDEAKNTSITKLFGNQTLTNIENDAGTKDAPKRILTTSKLEVPADEYDLTDAALFATANPSATLTFYTDDTFATTTTKFDNSNGQDANCYFKVTSADGANECYYNLYVKTTAAVPKDAVIDKVFGGSVTTSSGSGTAASPEVIVASATNATIAPSDIATKLAGETVELFSRSDFASGQILDAAPAAVFGTAAGYTSSFYAKVTSADGQTVKYYNIRVTRTVAADNAGRTEIVRAGNATSTISWNGGNGTLTNPVLISNVGAALTRVPSFFFSTTAAGSGYTMQFYTDNTYATEVAAADTVRPEFVAHIKVTSPDGLVTTYYRATITAA